MDTVWTGTKLGTNYQGTKHCSAGKLTSMQRCMVSASLSSMVFAACTELPTRTSSKDVVFMLDSSTVYILLLHLLLMSNLTSQKSLPSHSASNLVKAEIPNQQIPLFQLFQLHSTSLSKVHTHASFLQHLPLHHGARLRTEWPGYNETVSHGMGRRP